MIMKKLIRVFIFFAFYAPGFGQIITIDSSFGENGVVYFQDTLNFQYTDEIVKDNSNRILFCEDRYSSHSIYRYFETGEIDKSFGLNGKVSIIPKHGGDDLQIQTQQDNKLIMLELENKIDIGHTYIYKGPITLKRFLENGVIDTTYGDSGFVKIETGSKEISQSQILVQNDSYTLVYIDFYEWTPPFGPPPILNALIYRINPKGQIDTDFGDNGVLKLESLGFVTNIAATISQDNKIILNGCAYIKNRYHFQTIRFKQNGDLDTLFGDNGIALFEFPFCYPLTRVDPENSIYFYDDNDHHYNGIVCMYKIFQNGLIDISFADQGKLCIIPPTSANIYDFDFYDNNPILIGSYYKDSLYSTFPQEFIWFADKGKDFNESFINGEVFLLNVDDNIYSRKIWSINNDRVTIYGEKDINNRLIPFLTRFKIDKASNLENENKVEDANIFPNPTSGIFSLTLPEDFHFENATMTVYDVYGREVMHKIGMDTAASHDVSSLGNGIYFIELRQNERIFRNKLLITR